MFPICERLGSGDDVVGWRLPLRAFAPIDLSRWGACGDLKEKYRISLHSKDRALSHSLWKPASPLVHRRGLEMDCANPARSANSRSFGAAEESLRGVVGAHS